MSVDQDVLDLMEKKLSHDDFKIIYGLSMAKILAYTGHTFDEFPFLDRILETPDDGEDVSIVGVFWKYLDEKTTKIKVFTILSGI